MKFHVSAKALCVMLALLTIAFPACGKAKNREIRTEEIQEIPAEEFIKQVYNGASEPSSVVTEELAPGTKLPVDALPKAGTALVGETVQIGYTVGTDSPVYAFAPGKGGNNGTLVLLLHQMLSDATERAVMAVGTVQASDKDAVNALFDGTLPPFTVNALYVVDVFDYMYPANTVWSKSDARLSSYEGGAVYGVLYWAALGDGYKGPIVLSPDSLDTAPFRDVFGRFGVDFE